MTFKFYFWAVALIASLLASGLTTRSLALAGVPYAHNLLWRGVVCLLLVIGFAKARTKARRLTLKPKSIKKQLLRAIVAGLALSFFTLSYSWLTASAVAVLSNIDVPLLWVLGPLICIPASYKTRGLAVVSIAFLGVYIGSLEATPGLFYGLTTLGIGSVLLCFGYLFIKKSMTEENEAITILVPALAIIVYGFVQSLWGEWLLVVTPSIALQIVVSGASMFGAYYATMRLYEMTDLVSAEFPTLLASIIIQPLEAMLLGAPVQPIYFAASVGFVSLIYFVLRLQTPSDEFCREAA